MAEKTKIEWTDHTWSPWRSCQHALLPDGTEHPGCGNCYAEAMAKRNPTVLGVWGPEGTRVLAAEKSWETVRRWNAEAGKRGVRESVFPSVCDPFEAWAGPILDHHGNTLVKELENGTTFIPASGNGDWLVTMADIRKRFFTLIDECEHLDFLLLTKRPQNVEQFWPVVSAELMAKNVRRGRHGSYRSNVQLLYSASDQKSLDAGIEPLLKCRELSPVVGLSLEPLLGPVDLNAAWARAMEAEGWHPHFDDLNDCPSCVAGEHQEDSGFDCSHCRGTTKVRGIDWVIVGGESGPHARPMHPDWVRSLRDQCVAAGVPFFFKQWGEWYPLACDEDCVFGEWFDSDRAELCRLTISGQRGNENSIPLSEVDWPGEIMGRVGKKAAGRILDGREWSKFPEVRHVA